MSAKDNVVIRMSSEDAGAFEAWRKQAAGAKMLGDAIDNALNKGKRHTDELGGSVGNLTGKWSGLIAAVAAAKAMLEDYMKLEREREEKRSGAAVTIDESMRGYFTRRGISDPGQQQAINTRVGQVATARAATVGEAGSAMDLLAGYKFQNQDAEFAALDEALQVQKAARYKGGDSEFIKRVIAGITRSGGSVDAQSIQHFGKLATSMIGKATNYDPANAVDVFANVGTQLRRGGRTEDQGYALTAAVLENQDTRQATALLKEFAKPGMQAGEAAYTKRASELMAMPGPDYKTAVAIATSGPAAVSTRAQTAQTFTQAGKGEISREDMIKNLETLLDQSDVGEGILDPHNKLRRLERARHPGLDLGRIPILDWKIGTPDSAYSTEDVAAEQAGYLTPGHDFWTKEFQERKQHIKQQLLGKEPIPEIKVKVELRTNQGRDIPHRVLAADIPGR
jgi:hypothetical protein